MAFPPIIDVALLARARATAERNHWRSQRRDRPAELGILRYGFARCVGCGRALSVANSPRRGGRERYYCPSHQVTEGKCPSPASISVQLLDEPILRWLQAIIEDPSRADAYRVERRSAMPDAEALALAVAAEARVGEVEQRIAGLIDKLILLSGPAAEIAAGRLNALNGDLAAARAERDRLVAACRVTVSEDGLAIAPQDALAAAIVDAIQAMVEADPEPAMTFSVLLPVPGGVAEHYDVPLSWKAWQAALAVLSVTVAVAQEQSDMPRWVAEMRPAPDVVVTGSSRGYLFPSPASWTTR